MLSAFHALLRHVCGPPGTPADVASCHATVSGMGATPNPLAPPSPIISVRTGASNGTNQVPTLGNNLAVALGDLLSLGSHEDVGNEGDALHLETPPTASLGALLASFDEAWAGYLEQFLAWKGADAASLEVRAAFRPILL